MDHECKGVLGAGTIGCNIAVALAGAGFAVTLLDANSDALSRGMQRIADIGQEAMRRGKIDAAEAAARLARIRPMSALSALPVAIW